MALLLDTDLLVRRVHRTHPEHRIARDSLNELQGRGEEACVVVQNIYELWAVCTRPTTSRGLGLTPSQADRVLSKIEHGLKLLRDPHGLYDEWRRLVVQHAVSGKLAHDARLVAAMRLHGLTSILTFNVGDFRRYPGIRAVHPRDAIELR